MIVGRFPFAISVTTTDEIWVPFAKLVTLPGSKSLDYGFVVNVRTGNAVAMPGTSSMIARPEVIYGVSAASGSFANAQGTTHHATDTSAVTDRFFAQPGVLAKLSSGNTPAYIAGYLSVVHRACATTIGRREIEVDPNQTTAAPRFYLLGRVPASGGDKLRAAIIANAINDVDYLFYVRGVNDPDAPGSWSAVGSWTTIANGASGTCFADTSISGVTPSSYHMLEFAIAVRLKTAGSNPAGFLRVAAGLSYT